MNKITTILSLIIIYGLFTGYDSTDNGRKRSEMGLYVDNATGCHYLKTAFGKKLTPRLDRNGYQICTGQEFERINK